FGAVPHIRGHAPRGLHRNIRRGVGWLLTAVLGLTITLSIVLLVLGRFDGSQLWRVLFGVGYLIFTGHLFTSAADETRFGGSQTRTPERSDRRENGGGHADGFGAAPTPLDTALRIVRAEIQDRCRDRVV